MAVEYNLELYDDCLTTVVEIVTGAFREWTHRRTVGQTQRKAQTAQHTHHNTRKIEDREDNPVFPFSLLSYGDVLIPPCRRLYP